MRLDREYRDFLASDQPLHYLRGKIRDVDAFREHPSLARLLATSAEHQKTGDADGIDVAIVAFLEADTAFVLQALKGWVLDAVRDDYRLPPFKDAIEFENGLFHNVNLTKKHGVSVTASCISGGDVAASEQRGEGSRVVFSGQKVYFKILAGGPLALTVWECDPYGDDSEFSTLKCETSQAIMVSDGDIVEIDGTRQSLSFGQCRSTVVFLQVENLLKDARTSVAFDRTSGHFIGTYPTDRNALRRMAMCSALKHLGGENRIGELPATARDGPFYLRWHFLREMVAADPNRATDVLAEVSDRDRSPSVRRAAQATLQMLEKRRQENVA